MRKTFKYLVELYSDYEHNEIDAERYHFDTYDKADTFLRTSNTKRKYTKYCVYELCDNWEKRERKEEPVQIDEFKETLINILKKNS